MDSKHSARSEWIQNVTSCCKQRNLFTGKVVSIETQVLLFDISQYHGIPFTKRAGLDKYYLGGGGGNAL
jgi:hypothetical protein